ncbi:hypothetical protein LguiB_012606 [Lonicera macranthoides]
MSEFYVSNCAGRESVDEVFDSGRITISALNLKSESCRDIERMWSGFLAKSKIVVLNLGRSGYFVVGNWKVPK